MLYAKKLNRHQQLLSAVVTVVILFCSTTTALAVKSPVSTGATPSVVAPTENNHSVPVAGAPDAATGVPVFTVPARAAVKEPAAASVPTKQPVPYSKESSLTQDPAEKLLAPENTDDTNYTNGLGQIVHSGLSTEQIVQRNADAEAAEKLTSGTYPKNSKGETYGSRTLAVVVGYEPDLVAVIATNGKSGYVYLKEFYPAEIRTPEEAVAYTQQMPQNRTVPVYDTEGVPIGEFIFGGSPSDASIMTLEEARKASEDFVAD